MRRLLSKGLRVIAVLSVVYSALSLAQDSEIIVIDLDDDNTVDVRQYKSDGNKLLLGFACDEGTGHAEMQTAALMADQHLEVWMPDLLGAHFLPKLKSSLREIPTSDIIRLIDAAIAYSDKNVYLIASGPGSKVLLRGVVAWEKANPTRLNELNGLVLLFPRLAATAPEPGKDPVYIDAVGKSKTPIAILEGARTPNQWALPALKKRLEASGSIVTTALIPGVRGFFYEREKPNLSEDIVTSQLSGMVKASLVKLDLLAERETDS